MLHLLGVLGTQELLILLPLVLLIFIGIPVIAYNQGKKKGRLEGRLEEIERNKRSI